MIAGIDQFLIRWNNEHPLDHQYRKDNKIAFNSPQHRSISQLDILMEYLEEQLFSKYEDNLEVERKKKELYNKGIWLNENSESESSIDLFDKIDISSINKNSQIQIE